LVLTDKNASALDETARLIRANSIRRSESEVDDQPIVREADVTEPEQIAALCRDAIARFKRIDILVNNAAVAGPTRPVVEIALGDWEEVLRVNLAGALNGL
jgi:NAD(P)-dependent dehydrogenase (short-subunit alcohol dehydrogenase family)